MRIGTDMPSLEGATEWRNSDAIAREDLLKQPTLIHFWSISCHTCSELMGKINEWRDFYSPKGLRVIGVHMPRQESDTHLDQVYKAIDEYQITHPNIIDNLHKVADLFANEFVPALYLFDSQGKLRSFAAGEKAANFINPALERMFNK